MAELFALNANLGEPETIFKSKETVTLSPLDPLTFPKPAKATPEERVAVNPVFEALVKVV